MIFRLKVTGLKLQVVEGSVVVEAKD